MPRHAGLLMLMFTGMLLLAGCNMGEGTDSDAPRAENRQFLDALAAGTPEAGGGYLLAARLDRLEATDADRQAAAQAIAQTRNNPATVADARNAESADLNSDGLLTTDELVALSKAGLTEEQLLAELASTGYVFEVSGMQQDYLIGEGVSRTVVAELTGLNVVARRRAQQHYGTEQ